MRSRLIHARNQQSYSIRSLIQHLRRRLSAVADLLDNSFERDGTAVGHAGGESLSFHEVGEDAGVGGEAGESEPEV